MYILCNLYFQEVLKPVDKTQQEVNETVKNGAGDAPVVKKPADSPIVSFLLSKLTIYVTIRSFFLVVMS